MIDRNMLETFFDNDIRPDEIIHLGLQCMNEYSWPDAAEVAFEQDFEQVWAALEIPPPEEDEDEKWAIAEHLLRNGKTGFLVKYATPVPTRFSDNGYSTNGWGYYTTKWIYADEFEYTCRQAIKWQREYIERKRRAA